MKFLTILQSILTLILVVLTLSLSGALSKLKEQVASLQPSDYSTDFEQLQNKLDLGHSSAQALSKKISDDLESSLGSIEANHEKHIAILERKAENIILSAESSLDRKTLSAAKSLKMALTHAGSDTNDESSKQLAKLYFLNSLNQDPSQITTLTEYVNFVLRAEPDNLNSINQAKSVVETSLFELPTEDIATGAQLLEKLSSSESALNDRYVKAANPTINWEAELAKIESEPLEKIALNPKKIQSRRTALYGLHQEATSNGNIAVSSSIRNDLETLEKLSLISSSLQKSRSFLSKVNATQDKFSVADSTRLIMASNILMELLTIDFDALPDVVRKEHSELTKNLHTAQRTVADRLCSKQTANLKNALEKSKKPTKSKAPLQHSITQLSESLNQTATALSKTSLDHITPTVQQEYLKQVKSIKTQVQTLQKKQYSAYQNFTVKKCESALKRWNNERVVTDGDAINIYFGTNLREVDIRLLSPETNMVYNHVIQKIIGELPAAKAFLIEKQNSTATKKTLTQF